MANETVRTLHVNASDAYLGLPHKMFMAWHAVAELPELASVTRARAWRVDPAAAMSPVT